MVNVMATIKLNWSNANMKGLLDTAARIKAAETKHEEGTRGMWFSLVEYAAYAVADGAKSGMVDSEGTPDIDAFKAAMEKCGLEASGSRASERWSIAKLGEYACVRPLFKSLRGFDPLPSITSVYDVSNYVRGRGPWAAAKKDAKPTQWNGEGLDWKKESKNAPSLAQLRAGIKEGNAARNASKNAPAQTPEERIESFIEWL